MDVLNLSYVVICIVAYRVCDASLKIAGIVWSWMQRTLTLADRWLYA